MPRTSALQLSCPKCESLEAEFRAARERLLRMRLAAAIRERQLSDSVAVAIARAKEHQRSHTVLSAVGKPADGGKIRQASLCQLGNPNGARESCEKGVAEK